MRVSLADDLATCTIRTSRPCLTGQWLNTLEDRDIEAFNGWIADGGHLSTLYTRAMRNGFSGGLTTFKQHCRRACVCYRMMS